MRRLKLAFNSSRSLYKRSSVFLIFCTVFPDLAYSPAKPNKSPCSCSPAGLAFCSRCASLLYLSVASSTCCLTNARLSRSISSSFTLTGSLGLPAFCMDSFKSASIFLSVSMASSKSCASTIGRWRPGPCVRSLTFCNSSKRP